MITKECQCIHCQDVQMGGTAPLSVIGKCGKCGHSVFEVTPHVCQNRATVTYKGVTEVETSEVVKPYIKSRFDV